MFKILDIAGSGMSAQMLRLNTTASNMANAGSNSASEAEAYRARQPVFASVLLDAEKGLHGVEVRSIAVSEEEVPRHYEPGNPLADKDGFVYGTSVNPVEEMANMMSASRSYQSNAEVFSTTKNLLLRTLQMGK